MTMNDWRAELRLELENWSTPPSLPARGNRMSTPLFLTIGQLRLAYEGDLDPAEDISEQVIEEPSNNWPPPTKAE